MNSRPLIVLLVFWMGGAALAPSALAQSRATPESVLVEGTRDDLWVVETFKQPDGAAAMSVRERVDATSGKWREIAQLEDRPIAAAAVGNRLAVATSDGWRLLSSGSSFIGPSLPNGRVIAGLAGDGDALWALAGPSAAHTPEIFRWTSDQGWALMGRLPVDAAGGAGLLAVRDGAAWIAYVAKDRLYVDRPGNDGAWQHLADVPAASRYKLLPGGPAPLLAAGDAGGQWTIYDLSAKPAKAIQHAKISGPSDVAISGTSLRIVSLTSDGAKQIGFDDFGRGARFGPDTIAQVAPPVGTAEWPSYVLMGLMTAAMVVALRTRTPPSEQTLEKSHLRIAPLGRRIAAGVIDAVPYLLANIYVAHNVESGNYSGDMIHEVYLPVLGGLAVYVLHVGISEVLFGRSIGKFLFGLKVVSVDGTPAPAGRVILRNLMRVIDVSAVGLPFLLILLSPSGQRFGDMAARTLVVSDVDEEESGAGEGEDDNPSAGF